MNMNFVLFKPLKAVKEAFDVNRGRGDKENLMSTYNLMKQLFPKLCDCDAETIISRYVWEHRELVEATHEQAREFFCLCTRNIPIYKLMKREMKEVVLKFWLMLFQYNIFSGNESSFWNVLADFLFKVISEDSLLGLDEIIRDTLINDIKDQIARCVSKEVSAKIILQDYILLAILAASAERTRDVSEIMKYLEFFLSDLDEITPNTEALYDFKFKGNERWIRCNDKPKVIAEYFGCNKFSVYCPLTEKPVFSLKYVVLYYASKLLKIAPKELIGSEKALKILIKAIKQKDNTIISLKAIKHLLFNKHKDIPILDIIELACSLCSEDEYGSLLNEILKIIHSIPSVEIKLELMNVVLRTKLHQKCSLRARSVYTTFKTLEDFKYN